MSDGKSAIKVSEIKAGAVYQLSLKGGQSDIAGNAVASDWVPVHMATVPALVGRGPRDPRRARQQGRRRAHRQPGQPQVLRAPAHPPDRRGQRQPRQQLPVGLQRRHRQARAHPVVPGGRRIDRPAGGRRPQRLRLRHEQLPAPRRLGEGAARQGQGHAPAADRRALPRPRSAAVGYIEGMPELGPDRPHGVTRRHAAAAAVPARALQEQQKRRHQRKERAADGEEARLEADQGDHPAHQRRDHGLHQPVEGHAQAHDGALGAGRHGCRRNQDHQRLADPLGPAAQQRQPEQRREARHQRRAGDGGDSRHHRGIQQAYLADAAHDPGHAHGAGEGGDVADADQDADQRRVEADLLEVGYVERGLDRAARNVQHGTDRHHGHRRDRQQPERVDVVAHVRHQVARREAAAGHAFGGAAPWQHQGRDQQQHRPREHEAETAPRAECVPEDACHERTYQAAESVAETELAREVRVALHGLADHGLGADPAHGGGQADDELQDAGRPDPRQQGKQDRQGQADQGEGQHHLARAEPVHEHAAMDREQERQQRACPDHEAIGGGGRVKGEQPERHHHVAGAVREHASAVDRDPRTERDFLAGLLGGHRVVPGHRKAGRSPGGRRRLVRTGWRGRHYNAGIPDRSRCGNIPLSKISVNPLKFVVDFRFEKPYFAFCPKSHVPVGAGTPSSGGGRSTLKQRRCGLFWSQSVVQRPATLKRHTILAPCADRGSSRSNLRQTNPPGDRSVIGLVPGKCGSQPAGMTFPPRPPAERGPIEATVGLETKRWLPSASSTFLRTSGRKAPAWWSTLRS